MNGVLRRLPVSSAEIIPGVTVFIVVGRCIDTVFHGLRHTDHTGDTVAETECVYGGANAVQMRCGTDPHIDPVVMERREHILDILCHGDTVLKCAFNYTQQGFDLLWRSPGDPFGFHGFFLTAGTIEQIVNFVLCHAGKPV